MSGKKLLLVATRQFWPTTTGHEIVLYNNCKGLHEKYKYDIYLFCFANKDTDKNKKLPEFIKDVIYVDVPGKLSAVKTILAKSVFGEKWPLQASLYYDKAIENKLGIYYKEVNPEVIMIDMVRLVPYIYNLRVDGIKKILLAEDDLAKRYEKQLMANDKGNATGYYSKNMGKFLNKIVSGKLFKLLTLGTEIKKLRAYESIYLDIFDYLTFISPMEADAFNNRHNCKKAICITMGADIEYYSQEVETEHKKNSLVYVGNYTYAPNADSIIKICKNIIPKLGDDITFYVIGKCPDDLKKQIEGPNVKVLGFVDDIRKVVKSTDVYLSPISYGTGIKTKIVEAMAMEMPVVTNSVGAESLNVENGREMFILDNEDDIVGKVKELLNNSDLRAKIAKAGKAYVTNYHDWSKIFEAYKSIGL